MTEVLLFGVKTKRKSETFRTLALARSQVNLIRAPKKEHSRKPDEFYEVIEKCSPGPYLELFARGTRENWAMWGNQADESYSSDGNTYAYHTGNEDSRQKD